jgi:ankyrin repeat protein
VLHHACDGGPTNLFCLELLVQSGAKVNLLDDKGRSPLHYAALHDRASAGRLLMNRGANPKLKDAVRHFIRCFMSIYIN